MRFDDLLSFVTARMRMSHIYQPLLIRALVEAGGTATLRQLAHAFLAQDESQLRNGGRRCKSALLLAVSALRSSQGAMTRPRRPGRSFSASPIIRSTASERAVSPPGHVGSDKRA